MNKKIILIGCILAIFMLVSISFATAVNADKERNTKTRVSPLYRIRTEKAIKEKLGEIREYYKSRYIRERVFFLPFKWLRLQIQNQDQGRTDWQTCMCTLESTCKCNINQQPQLQQGRTNWNTCLCKI